MGKQIVHTALDLLVAPNKNDKTTLEKDNRTHALETS